MKRQTYLERQMFMNRRKKDLVIGLACAPPGLVFEQWRDELPNFKRVLVDGVWGRMEGCIHALTVRAWRWMMSSRDAGRRRFYGSRNQGDYFYANITLAN